MSTLSVCSTLLPDRGRLGRDSMVSDSVARASPFLQFYCIWEQNLRAFSSNPVMLRYFTNDDTVELRQMTSMLKPEAAFALGAGGAAEAMPLLLKRQRAAKCV